MGRQLLTLEIINVESGVSAFDGKGFCRIECRATTGDVMVGQLPPDELRAMALAWIAAADHSETDAILLDFLLHKLGLDTEAAGNVLLEIRRRRGVDEPGEEE